MIACDGSLMARTGGWAAVSSGGTVSGRIDTTSSNRCEVKALLEAIRNAPNDADLAVLTDATSNIERFNRVRRLNGPIPERYTDADLWEEIREAVRNHAGRVDVRLPCSEAEWKLHRQAHHACRREASWVARVGQESSRELGA